MRRSRHSSHDQSHCVCILLISFNFKLLKSKLTNSNILCLVPFRAEHTSGVTDSVREEWQPDRTITTRYLTVIYSHLTYTKLLQCTKQENS